MNLRRRLESLERSSPPPQRCPSCWVGGGGPDDGKVRSRWDAIVLTDDQAPGWAYLMCKRCGRAWRGRLAADGLRVDRCEPAEMPGI